MRPVAAAAVRFARCADGIREAFLANASRLLPSTPARPVDMDTWHLASDYQKVVDDVEEVRCTDEARVVCRMQA